MSIYTCNSVPCCCGCCCDEQPASSRTPPSPTPPWHRDIKTPVTQTLSDDGNVSLTTDVTYLDKTISSPSVPVNITIPNGNFARQYKTILIKGDKLATTETFNLAGTFAGYSSLTFDGVGFVAVLIWDSSSWVLVGGNVTTNP